MARREQYKRKTNKRAARRHRDWLKEAGRALATGVLVEVGRELTQNLMAALQHQTQILNNPADAADDNRLCGSQHVTVVRKRPAEELDRRLGKIQPP